MEAKQSIDLERVFKMFCERALIKEDDEIVIKELKAVANNGAVTIYVVTRYGEGKCCFNLYQGYYLTSYDEITDVDCVRLDKFSLNDILKFVV